MQCSPKRVIEAVALLQIATIKHTITLGCDCPLSVTMMQFKKCADERFREYCFGDENPCRLGWAIAPTWQSHMYLSLKSNMETISGASLCDGVVASFIVCFVKTMLLT